MLQAELDAYAKVGLFGGTAPDAATYVDAAPLADVYDGTAVIWPSYIYLKLKVIGVWEVGRSTP